MPTVLLDTIAGPATATREVERSRFVATLRPAADADAVAQAVAEVRRRWPDARHHATAVVLGPDGQRQRSSDDGEPAGTAGAPMLSVLVHAELTDVVAVVTRWFGGTLLGAGGLVRAYGGTLTDALDRAQRLRREHVLLLEVTAPIALAGRLGHALHQLAEVHHLDLGPGVYSPHQVTFPVTAPQEQGPAVLSQALAGLAADIEVVECGRDVRPVPVRR